MATDEPTELPNPEPAPLDDELIAVPGSEEQRSLLDGDDAAPDWAEHWKGMPGYEHQDLQPHTTLLVHFRSVADREQFARLVGQNLSATTKFIWHPKAEIGVAADKVWTGVKRSPRYPVYIISKGRWDTRLTSRAFEWLQIPYHIVVEPQEYDKYAAVIDPAKILVTPFSNLGQGGIPARNFVWEHSISTGAKRHWIFDDNVSGFCRFHDNMKIEVDSGIFHALIEDWVDRHENVAMAAFNYDYFAPRKQGAKIKPITLNTRCYSGILLSNEIPHRWRGRYNEDTDLSLRILKDGLCTALFNAFLMYKKPTLTMKGGNTDQLYAGAEATVAEWEKHATECDACRRCVDGYDSSNLPCAEGVRILTPDGRWLMAESLRQQHPDVTTVERKWRRWQHQVDYRRFQYNEVKVRPDASALDTLDMEMKLEPMPPGWGAMSSEPYGRGKTNGGAPKPVKPAVVKAAAPATPPRPQGPSALDLIFSQASQPAPAPPPEPEPVKAEARPAPEKPEVQPAAEPAPAPEPYADPEFAADLKRELEERGHLLLTRDGKLFVTESQKLTNDLRGRIKVHRPELLKLATPWIHPPEPEEIQATKDLVQALQAPSTPTERTQGGEPSADAEAASAREGVAPDPGEPALPAAVEEKPTPRVQLDLKVPEIELSTELLEADADALKQARVTSFFDSTPDERGKSLAQMLGSPVPMADPNWRADEPPEILPDEIVLNFATDGLDWDKGNLPVGVTVASLDGQLTRFLPFRFRGGGNLDEAAIKRWFKEKVRGKRITNANTRFEVHMSREWGCDLEEQGCTVSDVQHYAALLDDHRKRFALDVLLPDYLPDEPLVARLDERDHAGYAASEVAARELFTARVTAKLRNVMWPMLDAEELQEVRQLEDDCIFAICEMEKNGALIDVPLMERYHDEVNKRHGELMLEIADEAGFAFDGTAKGWQRLFERCGLTPSEDGYAEAIVGVIDHPLIKKAFFAGQCASLDSKTFNAYMKHIDANGVLRFDINQLRGDDGGTVSGRTSIGYVQQVPNLDNHSAVFGDLWFPREIFISSSGAVLEADAAQIEYRLFAHLACNPEMLRRYAEDPWTSFHKMTWEMIKAYKPDMLYTNQKSFNFARQYGAKMVKLALMMKYINDREAAEIKKEKRWNDPKLAQIKEIEAAYNKINPEGDELLDRAAHLAKPACDDWCKRGDKWHRQGLKHRGWVKTLAGRRSRFRDGYKTYIALNRVLQGGGADIMKKKLAELHRERKHTGLLMRMTVHDQVLGDAQMGETKERVEEVLNRQSYTLKVPILWEVGTGPNWAKAKK